MRRICANLSLCGLKAGDLDAIFITHHHSDHVSGLSMLTRHYAVPVYAPRTTSRHLIGTLACSEELVNVFPIGESLCFGDIKVSSFPTSHDTEESAGYRIEGEKTFALATDTGIVTDEVFAGLYGCEAVIIESNHDIDMLRYGEYPYYLKQRILSPRGHLSNDACAELATKLSFCGTKYIILGHLSRENNTPAKAFSAVSSAVNNSATKVYVAPEGEMLSLELGGELK